MADMESAEMGAGERVGAATFFGAVWGGAVAGIAAAVRPGEKKTVIYRSPRRCRRSSLCDVAPCPSPALSMSPASPEAVLAFRFRRTNDRPIIGPWSDTVAPNPDGARSLTGGEWSQRVFGTVRDGRAMSNSNGRIRNNE